MTPARLLRRLVPGRPAATSAMVAGCSAILAIAAPAEQEPWPQFRGLRGDGIARHADPPLEWSESSNVTWKIPVPARGHSSPVVRDGRIYLATAVEENTREERVGNNMSFIAERITIKVLAYKLADGSLLWESTLFEVENPDPIHTLNSFATPTPVADGAHLYCDFGTFGTACLDSASGTIVWKKRLPLDHEVGPGSSPAIHGELLILVRDGRDTQYVTALDKRTGEQRWKTMRPPLEGTRTDTHKAFATPAIIEDDRRPQVVVPGAQWLVSYHPETGRELWRCKHGKGFSIAPQPSVGKGLVIYCTGFSGCHMRAVRHDGSGELGDDQVAWKSTRWTPTLTSPVLAGDELFWVSDTGTACCADPASGEILWHKSLRGRFRASPILAAGRLYLIDKDATCHVLDAGREFKPLAVNRLDGQELTATPAFVGRSVIIRTHTHLYRIDKPAGGGGGD